MVTEMISLKLDSVFLQNIDEVVKNNSYHNRTEFIRTALRDKIEELKLKEAILELSFLKGKAKKKVSEKEYENIRNKALKLI